VRRLADVHLPKSGRHELEGSSPSREGVRRPRIVLAACLPALALIVWLGVELIGDGRLLLAALALLVGGFWLACVMSMVAGSARTWTLADLTRARTVRAVRRAMENGELELHYQPQLNIQDGTVIGVEALLRWRRRGAVVPPGEFLPAVEASPLVGPLTEHVLDAAVAQAGEWQREGRPLRVAVNLSPANLSDFRVVEQIGRSLKRHEVDPALLVLEVTETTVLENPERTRAVLDAICDLGASISIDDFGVGYSSLLWLRIFPVEEVKIDRSFVAQTEGEGRAFVEGVVRLANDLSMHVVAEGIEDDSTLRELQALGCDAGQGYMFSPALPASEVGAWIDEHRENEWGRRETTLTIAPDFDQIAPAREIVAAHAVRAGMSEADVWDTRVAVTEALANAIEHGARADDGLIHVRITEERGKLHLDIAGGGRGEGRAREPRGPERGRGISIMSGTMDSMKLTQERDRNLIQLAKSLNGDGESR
jgi:EAL domain-containing protein (putative c-di-GMP-specific phosphodiesterase class I)/anti-sigma regulatory factor (Ser/Thr protein kinase)